MNLIPYQKATETEYTQGLEELNNPDFRRDISQESFNLFDKFADRWGIPNEQRYILLGNIHRQTYIKWKSGKANSLARDVLERISVMMGIHKGLNLLFADYDGAFRWLHGKNSDYPFADLSPLDFMSKGMYNLYKTRAYIDSWRGVK